MARTSRTAYQPAPLRSPALLLTLWFLAAPVLGATLVVKPGESIQDAVVRSKPGDTVNVMAGTYHETVFIDKDAVRLHGVVHSGQWPVLDGQNQLDDGILVAGHGVTVEHLWVKRYKGNGIMTQGANNYRIVDNVVEGPCFYAIFPQFGRNGLVAHNVVFGSEDAAIYVGMSDSVDVVHNEAYQSIIGIESENSRNILIEDNDVHDNVLGVATTLLPGLPVKSADHLIIRNNVVRHNNTANFAPPGAITAGAPAGVGILVLGTDHTVVEGNLVRDNDSLGILIAETSFFVTTPDDQLQPGPDDDQILDNTFINNGSNPHDVAKDLLDTAGLEHGVDVMATGKGHDNCIADRSATLNLGLERFADCQVGATSAAVTTLRTATPVTAPQYTAAQKGRLTYLAVCSGCHTYNSKLIGPPMITIKALYGHDAAALAEWIAHPAHKRPDYPQMPPQSYLPPETRMAVASYILNELSH